MKKLPPKFYVLRKDFNSDKMSTVDILGPIFEELLTKTGVFNKKFKVYDNNYNKVPLETRDQLYTHMKREFMYYYWGKCECEFIVVDWPYKGDSVEKSRPIKIDMYEQIKPNLDIIVDLVWNYINL